MLDCALRYARMGLSVIPVRHDKRPYIAWAGYQKKKAASRQIEQWWGRWPDAMIGLVTGKLSNLAVVDVDTPEGAKEINKYIPLAGIGPTAQTPSGGLHHYFQCPDGLGSNARAIPGCDLRANGGYVVAPPSRNGEGKLYQWMKALSIFEMPLPALPEAYLEAINNAASCRKMSQNVASCRQNVTNLSPNVAISLEEGHRDNTLFHIANCLLKGGMPASEAEVVLKQLALSCTPAYPLADIPIKIFSVLKRINNKERNIAKEIREWVLAAPGVFSTSGLDHELGLRTGAQTKNRAKIIERLCQEGLIERAGDKRGFYRKIESQCEIIDFINAADKPIPLSWPLGLERYFRCMPKNIIVVAGEPDAGKTAFLLNFVQLNMKEHQIHYFCSEMGAGELRGRLSLFGLSLSDWTFSARERSGNFADVIQPHGVNIVDFLEMHDEFYKVGAFIKQIYDRLGRGICLIALQKNPQRDFGLGGARSLEKARLYLAMEPGKLKIVKCKSWADPQVNPNRLQMDFKLLKACQFIPQGQWHRQ